MTRLTPEGESALAVVRVRGASARQRLASASVADLPPPGRMRVTELRLPGLSERVLILGLPDGTGHELHLHGNPGLVRKALGVLAEPGHAAPARPALAQEILALATRAPSREGLRWCLLQLGERGLLGLAKRLAEGQLATAGDEARQALERGRWLRRHLEPARLLLSGRVNAGKSTLFNLLVGRERVRSGPEPALTRDSVEERILLEGVPFRLIDCAGEAEPGRGSDADREAARQARLLAAEAEHVLRVGSLLDSREVREARGLRIWTHGDREPAELQGELCVDLLAPEREPLRLRITEYLAARLGLDEPPPRPGPAWLDPRQKEWLHAVATAWGSRLVELGRSLLSLSPGE